MPTHVALLRGVNVGGRIRVAMSDLRAVLTSLAHTDVAFTGEPIGPDQLTAVVTAQQRSRDKGSRDEATVVGCALFLHTPGGLGHSELAAQLAPTGGPLAAGGSATVRNWSTVTALLALCQA
ncbi:MAG: DUF1697 domain-containing protein [Pseudonocardiaceae bacterium]